MAKSAIDRFLPITITYDDFLAYTSICACHYCGSPIKWSKDTKRGNSKAANLDRKNNELGYTTENIVVACVICNRIKNKYLTYDDMMLMSPILRRIIPGKHSHGKSTSKNY
jgi:5-methylcytosine-specific restriction endonuclease McrA